MLRPRNPVRSHGVVIQSRIKFQVSNTGTQVHDQWPCQLIQTRRNRHHDVHCVIKPDSLYLPQKPAELLRLIVCSVVLGPIQSSCRLVDLGDESLVLVPADRISSQGVWLLSEFVRCKKRYSMTLYFILSRVRWYNVWLYRLLSAPLQRCGQFKPCLYTGDLPRVSKSSGKWILWPPEAGDLKLLPFLSHEST